MDTHLPPDLAQFVEAKVRSGRFTSSDEAITEGVRLLRQREEAEEAQVLRGIQQGLDDMHAGRGRFRRSSFRGNQTRIRHSPRRMKYGIVVEPTAEREIRSALRWMTDNASPTVAARWYNGLIKRIDTLRRHPFRCPIAAEN